MIAFELILLPIPGGEQDDREAAHFPCQFADAEAVQVGHHDIQNHQIHRIVLQQHQRVHAVLRRKAAVPAPPHIFGNDFLHVLFVFHNQNARHGLCPPSCPVIRTPLPLSFQSFPIIFLLFGKYKNLFFRCAACCL